MKCGSYRGSHGARSTRCSFCWDKAVFHWTARYPDLFLCATCLWMYPGARGERLEPLQNMTRQNDEQVEGCP